jgi:hypothetical protein
MYDATGHMAVQIQPDRRRASWSGHQPNAEQALDAVTGYTAYFGTYKVDEATHMLTHHREGALNFDMIDYVVAYEFDATGRLVLTGPAGGRVVWERIKR